MSIYRRIDDDMSERKKKRKMKKRKEKNSNYVNKKVNDWDVKFKANKRILRREKIWLIEIDMISILSMIKDW